MSRSLFIECDWVDEPSARDPLERRTWAGVRIVAATRTVTRVWDRCALGERSMIYVPAFPLARWIVTNWWTLLNEPSPSENALPLNSQFPPRHREWLRRHCFRSAESGLALPRLCLFSDGRDACLQWLADDPDAYPHMPVHFVESGLVSISQNDTHIALREFIVTTLDRLDSIHDERVIRLRDNWRAIVEADNDEQAFCRAAGRMGLDPYESDQWNETLVSLLETGIGNDPERPIVEDFLEAADPATAVDLWNWVQRTESSVGFQASPEVIRVSTHTQDGPANTGYRLSQLVREKSGITEEEPVRNLTSLSHSLGITTLGFEDGNHVPGESVRAAVGWRTGEHVLFAGPKPPREDNLRFLQARGLYCAAFACDQGPRLITSAHTWDQQASRAFAAELLAPRQALLGCISSRASQDEIDALASKYMVSAKVIEHQLENAGIDIGPE